MTLSFPCSWLERTLSLVLFESEILIQASNLRKVIILLNAIERTGKRVHYYALDLSISELRRTLSAIPEGTFKHVRCYGLHGTYDDGLEWLKLKENASKPKCVMWLGSSIGNFNRDEAANFLKRVALSLRASDTMLIGVDGCQDARKIYHAYNDREGKTHEFILNGLTHANKLLGKKMFHLEDWEVIGEYDEIVGRHQAFVVPKKDLQFDNIYFAAGERIRIEESYKYSALEVERLWENAGFTSGATFADQMGQYRELPHAFPFSEIMLPAQTRARILSSLSHHAKRSPVFHIVIFIMACLLCLALSIYCTIILDFLG